MQCLSAADVVVIIIVGGGGSGSGDIGGGTKVNHTDEPRSNVLFQPGSVGTGCDLISVPVRLGATYKSGARYLSPPEMYGDQQYATG